MHVLAVLSCLIIVPSFYCYKQQNVENDDVADLREMVIQLAKKNEELMTKYEDLHDEQKDAKLEIKNLKSTQTTSAEELRSAKLKIKTLQSTQATSKEELYKQLRAAKLERDALKETARKLKSALIGQDNKHHEDLEAYQGIIDRKIESFKQNHSAPSLMQRSYNRHSGSPIGTFYVTLTNTLSGISAGQTIIFERVWYSTGEYSTGTGIFLCPVTGVYSFSMTSKSCPAQHAIELDMKVNGVVVAKAYSGLSTEASTGSKTVMISCSQLQEVYVVHGGGHTCLQGFENASFSGFLLYQTA